MRNRKAGVGFSRRYFFKVYAKIQPFFSPKLLKFSIAEKTILQITSWYFITEKSQTDKDKRW